MTNQIKTEDQVKISKIVEKLVKQNSKRTRDILLSCPELSGSRAAAELNSLVPRDGPAHTYRTGQLLSIGRQVAHRMVDPSQGELMPNRGQLDDRLRSAGIYHNRLGHPYVPPGPIGHAELEEGGQGDTDPSKSNASKGN
ncbi:uncharacterized protein LOC108105429 [Drosophila eugracilis]|uniref:uncharacterized protein LOC108105429 n=1 Tax=Drosophila eugracilis TaxID=29029 RepID=UPI0007E75E00|nr:uncharacterized protein LOC108105429 [Drosophila eugracilis]